jgi:hypothetical protein
MVYKACWLKIHIDMDREAYTETLLEKKESPYSYNHPIQSFTGRRPLFCHKLLGSKTK